MSAGKPTPGPWETSVNDEGQWDVCAEGGGDMVADLSASEHGEADARLIAAAPDLLAALKAMFADACDCGPDVHCRSCELGLRAIAKAEGKS